MRRWNGWGDDTRDHAVPPALLQLLRDELGPATPGRDAALDDVVSGLAPPRLEDLTGASTDGEDRVRHSRGQGFPDLVATRSGRLGAAPDAVVRPRSSSEVREVLAIAADRRLLVVPWGGGTSVVGGVTAPTADEPVLTVDLSRLSGLVALDRGSRLATFGAGTPGPRIEALLRAQGGTLGHFPQSFELSTLGGWVATRSVGQQSIGFGAIDELFVGGRLESPVGSLELPPYPRSAAGPDLRQLVLGSEGRFGILTDATVRVRPLPEVDHVHAAFLPSWQDAVEATRALAQSETPLSMLRLSTAQETAANLSMAHGRGAELLRALLAARGLADGACLLLVGVMGTARQAGQRRRDANAVLRRHDAVLVGRTLGRRWQRGRFDQPYLRNSLWDQGYGVDTVETATTWSRVPRLLAGVETALRDALLPVGERVQVVTHLSHVYPTGSSIYTTFVFRLGADSDETMHRWRACKDAAGRAIVAGGGTISHQHGVGTDHREHLPVEKGRVGTDVLRAVAETLDPQQRMNPGKLL